MKYRGHWKAKAFAAALAAVALVAPAAGAEPLRVCADPDNLPFSKAEGPQRGMYIDLAELVGKQLGRPVEYVWYATHYQRRALRNTILQDGCDAVFALPADADYKVRGLQRSKPFMAVSYAIVAAPGYAFKSLDDLKKRHLAVSSAAPRTSCCRSTRAFAPPPSVAPRRRWPRSPRARSTPPSCGDRWQATRTSCAGAAAGR